MIGNQVQCSRATCNENGDCQNGKCVCDAGYEGDLCQYKPQVLTPKSPEARGSKLAPGVFYRLIIFES